MTNSNPNGSDEHFLKTWWRPSIAILYVAICAFDFIIFPTLNLIGSGWLHWFPYQPWQPLTLQEGGLIHAAFGSILTMSVWTRTNEKIAGLKANDPAKPD